MFSDLSVVCLYIFLKHLNLHVIIKMILILELLCCCSLANKAAESYEFFADQTSPTSSKELVESSEIFGVEKCRRRETYSDISDILELFNWPRKLLYYKILVILSILAMIFFPLLAMTLSSNLVNLNSHAKP